MLVQSEEKSMAENISRVSYSKIGPPLYHFNVSGVGPRYLIFHWNESTLMITHEILNEIKAHL